MLKKAQEMRAHHVLLAAHRRSVTSGSFTGVKANLALDPTVSRASNKTNHVPGSNSPAFGPCPRCVVLETLLNVTWACGRASFVSDRLSAAERWLLLWMFGQSVHGVSQLFMPAGISCQCQGINLQGWAHRCVCALVTACIDNAVYPVNCTAIHSQRHAVETKSHTHTHGIYTACNSFEGM